MTSEPEKPDDLDEDKTITEIGRELLKYLQRRLDDLGTNQASYRQARMELLRVLSSPDRKRFNWGFEAVFTQEIHVLEELGLVAVKYGSGAIMAGRSSPNTIYNLALTDDGMDTARIIIEREDRARTDTARLEDQAVEEELADDDEDEELDETDREPESTVVNKPDLGDDDEDEEDQDDTEPPPQPGSEYSHDGEMQDESEKDGEPA